MKYKIDMALIDTEIIRKEIKEWRDMDYPCDSYEQATGFYDAIDLFERFLNSLIEQPKF